MRILAGIIFLILSTILGFIYSGKFVYKSNFYKGFINFHKTFLNELNFSQKTLVSIISSLDKENQFNCCLIKYIDTQKFEVDLKFLTEDEIFLLKNYFENIGLYDKTTQLNLFNGFTPKIDKFYDQAVLEEKKYKSLYSKLGFLLGLIGLIVLI